MRESETGAAAERHGDERPALGADLIIPGLALAFTTYYLITTLNLTWEAKANGVVVGVSTLHPDRGAAGQDRPARRPPGRRRSGFGELARFDTAAEAADRAGRHHGAVRPDASLGRHQHRPLSHHAGIDVGARRARAGASCSACRSSQPRPSICSSSCFSTPASDRADRGSGQLARRRRGLSRWAGTARSISSCSATPLNCSGSSSRRSCSASWSAPCRASAPRTR